jgi:hypothetical protein
MAHEQDLTESVVESGVVLRLYILLINTKYCAYALTYTVCCREWRNVERVEAIFCWKTGNIAHARALRQSVVESGAVLSLYSLLLNTKYCSCARTYRLLERVA